MELNQLKQFLAVAETGSFAAAAEKLYVSRPAVSKSMALLERESGCLLFERSHSGASLTENAKELLPHIRTLVYDFEKLERKIDHLRSPHEKVRIGLTYGLNIIFLDRFEQYRERHPEVTLQIINCTFDQFPQMLKEGELDIGCSGMRLEDTSGLSVLPAYRSEVYWGVSAESEIAQRGYILEDELTAFPHCIPKGGNAVMSDRETITCQTGDNEFKPDDGDYQNIFDDNMFYLLKLVERGEGILCIARDAIPTSIKGVTFVPCIERKRYWEVQVYLPQGEPSKTVQQVLNEIFLVG